MEINDTSDQALRVMIDGYRRMKPADKMRQVDALTRTVQKMALARIREKYGDIPEKELKLRLASLWLDRETMVKVFGWDPEKEGY